MANKLTNLRINSVDSVDKGAGIGVKVLLMKRDNGLVDDLTRKIEARMSQGLTLAQAVVAILPEVVKLAKRDNEGTKQMNAIDILKRDGAVARDVANNI